MRNPYNLVDALCTYLYNNSELQDFARENCGGTLNFFAGIDYTELPDNSIYPVMLVNVHSIQPDKNRAYNTVVVDVSVVFEANEIVNVEYGTKYMGAEIGWNLFDIIKRLLLEFFKPEGTYNNAIEIDLVEVVMINPTVHLGFTLKIEEDF